MKLPTVKGNPPQAAQFVFAACDSTYFNQFGHVFVRSLRSHCDLPVHIHLFNPTNRQLDWVSTISFVTATYEHVDQELFKAAAGRLVAFNTQDAVLVDQHRRTANAMLKGNDLHIIERMQKTYYACARFTRLKEIYQPDSTAFAVDIDAVVRKPFNFLPNDCDFYIHRVTGKNPRFLAGGIQLNPCSRSSDFISTYSNLLVDSLEKDYIYWGLDQDLLENLVTQYKYQQLPFELIDWNMGLHSAIWTAKGARKSVSAFVNECAKYKT